MPSVTHTAPRNAPTVDVIIAGAGPAALLLAHACRGRGLDVAVVAPDLDTPWTARYAVWQDEWTALGLGQDFAGAWPRALVRLDAHRSHLLQRPYATLDNPALQRRLLARLPEARRVIGHVSAVRHHHDRSTVQTVEGAELHGRLVVDATGGIQPWTQRHPGAPTAFQTAWGVRVNTTGDALPGGATLMDFSTAGPPGAGPASFLYSMRLPDGTTFLEETVLVHRPAIAHAVLRNRLERRLQHLGIVRSEPLEIERCTIPMDMPLPLMPQRTLAFGAAAGYVHPATGYMVGYAARMAPTVADALADGLSGRGRSLDSVAADAWQAIWPREALRTRALYLLGAIAAARFDLTTTRQFFDTFFALPTPQWSGYLARSLSVQQLAPVMLRIYRRSDGSIRRALRAEFIRRPALGGAALLGLGTSTLMAAQR